MKRTYLLSLGALAAAALLVGLVSAVLRIAQVSEPAAATVYGPTVRRLWATAMVVLALGGSGLGGLALARPASRFGSRSWAFAVVTAGAVAALNGGLVLAVADGGPGSGNGVVGGAAALVLGLTAIVLGGLRVIRARARTSG